MDASSDLTEADGSAAVKRNTLRTAAAAVMYVHTVNLRTRMHTLYVHWLGLGEVAQVV